MKKMTNTMYIYDINTFNTCNCSIFLINTILISPQGMILKFFSKISYFLNSDELKCKLCNQVIRNLFPTHCGEYCCQNCIF